MIVTAIMWQLQRIQRLDRAIGKDPVELGGAVFDVIEAVWSHMGSEELMLGERPDVRARAEWDAHRAHHAKARLACFALATCHAAELAPRTEELRAILRAHARHEMQVVSALRSALGGDPLSISGRDDDAPGRPYSKPGIEFSGPAEPESVRE